MWAGREERFCKVCRKIEARSIEKLEAFAELSKENITIKAGKTYVLKVKKVAFGDYRTRGISSNKKIATVENKGEKELLIKALKKGKCKITVVLRSGYRKTCVVTVK